MTSYSTLKDRFGNVPYALIHTQGRAVAFTAEDVTQARAIAKICRCGTCDCCAVAQSLGSSGKA